MKQDKKKDSSESMKKEQEKAPVELNFVEKCNDFGKIKLTDSVILAVIKKAACRVDGVTRLSGGSVMDNIASMISSQRIYDRAIVLKIKEDCSLEVEVKINVLYGENIPNVASKVQNTIRDEVKNILSLKVAKVNIIIQEIEYIAPMSDDQKENK